MYAIRSYYDLPGPRIRVGQSRFREDLRKVPGCQERRKKIQIQIHLDIPGYEPENEEHRPGAYVIAPAFITAAGGTFGIALSERRLRIAILGNQPRRIDA